MKGITASNLFFSLLLFKEVLAGTARTQHVRSRRGLKGLSTQQTTLLESDGKIDSTIENERNLEDEPPCTEYYSNTRKSKFNRFDDDWYTPCKTIGTARPSETPKELKTREPSMSLSTTSPAPTPSDSSLSIAMDQIDSKIDNGTVLQPTTPSPVPPKHGEPLVVPSEAPDNSDPILVPSKAPVESEQTSIDIEIDLDIPTQEKTSSCIKAKAGQVFPTPVNFTIHYKYELLAKRDADLTGVVWPEVDRAFQRFLALTLIDCDIDVNKSGASKTFKSRLKSISPEPIDSVGSMYPNGWSENVSANSNANSCTKILIDDELLAKRGLYCDVVTGSITLYLSEVSYMDNARDPSFLFMEYRDEVFQFLQDEINEGGEAISNYFDDSLGIRGFHFLSESTDLNLRPISIPDAASDERKDEWNLFGSREGASMTTVIAGSLSALIGLTVVIGAFALFRKRKDLDTSDDIWKVDTTPRMDDNEMEFYDIDNSNHDSPEDSLRGRSKVVRGKMFFEREGKELEELFQDSGDEMETSPQADFDTNYDLHERSSQLSTSYDYSQQGVSIRLQSPDKKLSIYSSKPRPDPSVVQTNHVQRKSVMDPDMNREPIEKSVVSRATSGPPSTGSRSLSERKSMGSRSTSESSVSSSKYVDAVKGSPALEYILALGSAYLGSSEKPFDEESTTENQNDVESSSVGSSSIGKKNAVSPDAPGNKKFSRKIRTSPNTVTDFNSMNSPPSLSPLDDGSSTQSPMSSASVSSNNSRVEYLKNRRKELENRFQNYRRSLSESMDNLSQSPSGSWLSSHESSRSASLYKNLDKSASPSTACSSNVGIFECGKSKTSDSKLKEEQRSLINADSKRSSLEDFEEILDNDDAWGIEPPEGHDEKYAVDNFLSSRSPKMRLESDPTRFQANTVIL